jgi:Txe/YoeB family toxin of toxin-antitoxin system
MFGAVGLVKRYKLYYTNRAKKDAQLIKSSNLKNKVEEILKLIAQAPYSYPPEFEFLKGELKGAISRRINKQHRLVYQVVEEEKAIKVLMMWTHYE